MSFLDSIKQRKTTLRPSETILTNIDGKKYRIYNDETTQLEQSSAGYVIDTKPDLIPSKIIDHLYLGSQDSAFDMDVLNRFDIKYVLSIGVEAPKYPNIIRNKFVQLLDLPETDLESSLRDECVPFLKKAIDDEKCNVLVHCNAGVSRAPSVVIGYLILSCGYSYKQAFKLVKAARSCIRPNAGFEKQLQLLKA